MKHRILIFGGTSESRTLAQILAAHGHHVTLSVTTDYGREIADGASCEVVVQKLDAGAMGRYLSGEMFDYVIDATHPFAEQATQNIRSACKQTQNKYLRLIRKEEPYDSRVNYVETSHEAADRLARENGNILFTIGIRKLEEFVGIPGFAARSYVRILPMADSIEKALSLGIKSCHLICMHGPFDVEMNKALIAMTQSRFLVTKDSGDAGGLDAKIAAAKQTGCRVIVLNRPREQGNTFDEILSVFGISPNAVAMPDGSFSHFPLFIDLWGKHILVIGGGKVAERRIGILRNFGAQITLVSPELTNRLQQYAEQKRIQFYERPYQNSDLIDHAPFLVIAATNDRNVNRSISEEARSRNIFCSVADNRAECNCFFPAIMESSSFLAGLVSKDGNHRAVRDMAAQIRQLFKNETNNENTTEP